MLLTVIGLVFTGSPVAAAILQFDNFTTDTESWDTRDGELSVAQDSFSGGVLSGTFGAANPGDVVTDAFRLTGIGPYPGYVLTAISFDFYSLLIVPSDISFRFGNGFTTFFHSLALGSVGGWSTYNLALDNQSGWLGGPPGDFTNVLSAATFFDIQLTQNGTAGQTFYVDNFQLEGEFPGYGGGGDPSAVPEPGTMSLMMLVVFVAMALRNRRRTNVVAVQFGILLTSLSASPGVHAEDFDSSTAEWLSQPSGSMNLSQGTNGNPGGSLQGSFSAQQNAFPQSGSFIGPESFVASQFASVGDLRSCLLGFDFKAGSTNPAAFRVRIGDSSSRQISRFLNAIIDDIDHWYSFRLSLASPGAGSWDGDIGLFDEIIQDVSFFSIDISRNGENVQSYQLDNVFVDALPDAGKAKISEEETIMSWQNLRSGETYRVEASASLNPAAWFVVESFAATGDVHISRFNNTNKLQFFRMTMPSSWESGLELK